MTDSLNGNSTAQIRPTGLSIMDIDVSRFSRECYEDNKSRMGKENTPKTR